MKRLVIIFKNHNKLEFDVPDIDLYEIIPDMPLIFDNLYINTSEILTIEVKEL